MGGRILVSVKCRTIIKIYLKVYGFHKYLFRRNLSYESITYADDEKITKYFLGVVQTHGGQFTSLKRGRVLATGVAKERRLV